MAENFQNFYVTKLREACDAVATTIYVDTVPSITEGTLVIEYANSTKHEIIHFTGVSGYGLTGCTRGLEGTTAQSHSAGVDVRQNLTAGMIDKIINGVITTENIADGAVTADKIDFTTLKRWSPDYANKSSTNLFSSSTSATMTGNGFIEYEINYYNTSSAPTLTLKINDKSVQIAEGGKDLNNNLATTMSGMRQVSVGDVVTLTKSGNKNYQRLYFIPGKWV